MIWTCVAGIARARSANKPSRRYAALTHARAPPHMRSMMTSTVMLIVVTVFGALVFFGLERKNVRSDAHVDARAVTVLLLGLTRAPDPAQALMLNANYAVRAARPSCAPRARALTHAPPAGVHAAAEGDAGVRGHAGRHDVHQLLRGGRADDVHDADRQLYAGPDAAGGRVVAQGQRAVPVRLHHRVHHRLRLLRAQDAAGAGIHHLLRAGAFCCCASARAAARAAHVRMHAPPRRQFSIPVGGVALGKVAGTLLELGEWALYSVLSSRISKAYAEANKNGDGILDYDDMRLAIQKAQGQEIDPKDFRAVVKENDAFETHEITKSNFTHIYLKIDKDEMQDVRATDRAKVCSLLVIGWLLLGMFYFSKAEGWSASPPLPPLRACVSARRARSADARRRRQATSSRSTLAS